MNGILGGTMVVNNGRLQGVGTVGPTTIAAGGIHAPGNSIGTQTIAGNYFNHGTLEIEANSTGADKLIVTSGVDIAGSALVLDLSPATANSWIRLNGPFIIIDKQSIGAVSGTFAFINNNLIFLDPIVNYAGGDGNDVTLALTRNDITFASIGQTFNQIGTAGGIESLPDTSPVWKVIALTADPETVRAAFDQLSGEIHASGKTALIEDSSFVREAINGRLRGAFGNALAPADSARFAAWGSVFGAWGSTAGDGNAERLGRSTGGFVTGFDSFAAKICGSAS